VYSFCGLLYSSFLCSALLFSSFLLDSLLCCASRICPRPQGTRRADSAPLCSLHSPCFACFVMHLQAHSVLSPPAALVLRFARFPPPPRYETSRFSSPVLLANSMFCVFWIVLPGPFCAELAGGARAALRAFVPAPRVRDARIPLLCAPCKLHVSRVLCCTSRSILC
jgi:hypothetical protein